MATINIIGEFSEKLNMPTTTSTAGQIQINSASDLHTYGTDNTFIGSGCGNFTLTGISNVGVGTGSNLSAATTAKWTCAIGHAAVAALTTGFANTAIGYTSLVSVIGGGYNICV